MYKFKSSLLLLLFIPMIILTSCTNNVIKNDSGDNEKRQTSIRSEVLSHSKMAYTMAFFPEQNGNFLVPVAYPISESCDIVKIAVEKILAGAPDNTLKNVIPEGCKLTELYTENNVVYIKLVTEPNKDLENINLAAFSATVNFALNSYNFNFRKTYPINLSINDTVVGNGSYDFNRPNSCLSDQSTPGTVIFYADNKGNHLIPTYVTLKKTSTKNDFYTALLSKWASKPPDRNLTSPVNQGTKVNSALFSNNCLLVDLNQKALAHKPNSQEAKLFLTSLLYTLAPYPEIKNVQILINGQKIAPLQEDCNLKTPISVPHSYDNLNIVSIINK